MSELKELQRVAEEVINCVPNRMAAELQALLRNIGGWEDFAPSESEIARTKARLGEEKYRQVVELPWPDTSIHDEAREIVRGRASNDVESLEAKISHYRKWVDEFRELAQRVYKTKEMLRDFIANSERTLTPQDAVYLEDMLEKIYDDKLADERTVYRLHRDGRITRTAGGDVYGYRSVFCEVPAVVGLCATRVENQPESLWTPFIKYEGMIECTLENAKAWRLEFLRAVGEAV